MHCQETQRFWFTSLLGLHVPTQVNLSQWMMKWLSNSNAQATQLFSLSLWTIWKMRNDAVFNKRPRNVVCAAQNVSAMADGFNLACNLFFESDGMHETRNVVIDTWLPVQAGSVKVNIDAGCFKDNYTCWGLISRDHQGVVQVAATKSERITCSPNLAEALGLRWCLQWVKTQNLQNVVIEMDAANVVNCIMGKLNCVEIDFIIVDCLDILVSLLNVSVVAVKRCKNKAAHALVGVARSVGTKEWIGNVPDPVSSIVNSELL